MDLVVGGSDGIGVPVVNMNVRDCLTNKGTRERCSVLWHPPQRSDMSVEKDLLIWQEKIRREILKQQFNF